MPVTFTTTLLRFGEKGEKTGWTYIVIPVAVSETLKPGQRTSFRVKGQLDTYPLTQVALLPMGQHDEWSGAFIMPLNADLRRALRKEAGATVRVTLDADDSPLPPSADLLTCLADDPAALAFFESLPPGHQRYYSQWIDGAKTMETRTKRITQAVTGFSMGMGYSEMTRHFKAKQER